MTKLLIRDRRSRKILVNKMASSLLQEPIEPVTMYPFVLSSTLILRSISSTHRVGRDLSISCTSLRIISTKFLPDICALGTFLILSLVQQDVSGWCRVGVFCVISRDDVESCLCLGLCFLRLCFLFLVDCSSCGFLRSAYMLL